MTDKKKDLLAKIAQMATFTSLVFPFLAFAQVDENVAGTMLPIFTPLDRLISNPAIEVVAPEFSPTGLEMSYCSRDGRVHIIELDSTGGFRDPAGTPDSILGECEFLTNGPEWGYTATELILAWTAPENSQGNTQLAVATRRLDSVVWSELNPLPGSQGLTTPYPIRNSESRRPWLLFSTGSSKAAAMIYNISGSTPLPTNNPYPTWKPDSYEVADVDPQSGEIVSLNVLTGSLRVASNISSSRRFNPWLWIAPETGAEAAFVFNLTSGCIEFYEQTGETAEADRVLCGADFGEGAEIVTPEPFILRERSYVSFLVDLPSDAGSVSRDIYVAGALDFPGEEPYLERTSSDEFRFRRDPEPVVNWRAGLYLLFCN